MCVFLLEILSYFNVNAGMMICDVLSVTCQSCDVKCLNKHLAARIGYRPRLLQYLCDDLGKEVPLNWDEAAQWTRNMRGYAGIDAKPIGLSWAVRI